MNKEKNEERKSRMKRGGKTSRRNKERMENVRTRKWDEKWN